jgi:hypothetical protein
VKVNFYPGFTVVTIFIYRDVYGSNDPDGQSNTKREYFYLCSTTATDPRCPAASTSRVAGSN